ncbi:bromodomain-containing protein 4-like [Antennarius striatus]|uniref:bromodomain-containing protein 4-like n=1 Tax=Antennarius striatus TaxID=241820 RepID=UPI0035B4A730
MDADDTPNPPKVRTGFEFSNLTRCASCYSQQKNRRQWGDGESSSSDEGSGPGGDCESESESSSSSSEIAEVEKLSLSDLPQCGGKDSDRGAGAGPTGPQPDAVHPKPRLPRVVTTLHLQVLPLDDNSFCIVEQPKSEGGSHPQTALPWQQESQTTQQQLQWSQHNRQPPQPPGQHNRQPPQPPGQHHQQPHYCPPLWAPERRLPLVLNTLPGLPQAPPTPLNLPIAPPPSQLRAPSSQSCWHCATRFPYPLHCPHVGR